MYPKYLILVFLTLFSTNSLASNEDWYLTAGLGSANVSNDTDLKESIDNIKNGSSSDEFSLGMDLIGIYMPFAQKQELLWGLALHCDAQFVDSYPNSTLDLSILNYTMALSSMYFPSKEHGRGVYFRGDAGLARNMVVTDGSNDIDEKLGAGALFGMGYGIPISNGTRILLGANYSVSFVRGGEYKALSLMVTGMW